MPDPGVDDCCMAELDSVGLSWLRSTCCTGTWRINSTVNAVRTLGAFFLQEDRSALAQAQQQLQVERSVNRKLLKSKGDVEYRLMEALSQQPSSALVGDAEAPPGSGASPGAADAVSPLQSPSRSHGRHSADGRRGNSPQIPRLQLQHAPRHNSGSLTLRRQHRSFDVQGEPHGRGSPVPPSGHASRHGSGRVIDHRRASGDSSAAAASRSSTPQSRKSMSNGGVVVRSGRPVGEAAAERAPGSGERTAAAVTTAACTARPRTPLQDASSIGRGPPPGSARAAGDGAVTARPAQLQASVGEKEVVALVGSHASVETEDGELTLGLRRVATRVRSVEEHGCDSCSIVAEEPDDPARVMHAWAESQGEGGVCGDSDSLRMGEGDDTQGDEEVEWLEHGLDVRATRRHVWRREVFQPSGCAAVSASSDLTPRPHNPMAGEGRGGMRGGVEGLDERVRQRGGTGGGVAGGDAEGEVWEAQVSAVRADEQVAAGMREWEGRWRDEALAGMHAGMHGDVAAAMQHRLALDFEEGGRVERGKGSPVRSGRERVDPGGGGVSSGGEKENQGTGVGW